MLQVCVEGVSRAEEGLHTGGIMIMMMMTMTMTVAIMTMTVTTIVIILAEDQLFVLLDPPLLCTGKLPQVLPGNLHRLENRYSLLYLLPLLIF